MATFNVVGLDEFEKMILKQADEVERIAPDMLKAGAEILADAQRSALRALSKGDRSIGTLAGSIGIGNAKKSASSVYMDVYPQGDQPHGVPRKGKRGRVTNAQVGFELEYGHSVVDVNGKTVGNVPARPWMSQAAAKAAPAIHEAMRKVWEDKQDG